MVRNEDVKEEFTLFSEIWSAYKQLLPVKRRHDVKYWAAVTKSFSEIMGRHPGPLAKALSLAILDDLERRCIENENQNTGR